MLVSPRPGVNRENLLDSLRRVYTDVANLHGRGGTNSAYQRLLDYLNWASDAVAMLGSQISSADLDRLVLTRRHAQLLAGVGTLAGTDTTKVVNLLVSLELRERVDAFDAAVKALNVQIEQWSEPGEIVVPDSSFYIEHEQKLEDADFHAYTVTVWPDHPVHVLVPIVVVDELDGLKRTKDPWVRWRAGYTLAVMDRLFEQTTGRAVLRQPEVSSENPGTVSSGGVTMEIVFDTPGHVRLPINDDEIVDRAVAIQALVGRDVTLLTYDTSQASRGRRAGLKVKKLSMPIGEEPTSRNSPGKKS